MAMAERFDKRPRLIASMRFVQAEQSKAAAEGKEQDAWRDEQTEVCVSTMSQRHGRALVLAMIPPTEPSYLQ